MGLKVKLPTKPKIRLKRTLVRNDKPPKKTLTTILVRLEGASTRKDTYLGKEYLVVPCVMLTEGVHAGSEGPILYLNQDMAIHPQAWNKKPIVVYHPTINGQGVSACDPGILDSCEIGLIFNTQFDSAGNRLTAEAWIDEDRCEKVDDRILKAVENGQMVELSTGLFMSLEMADEGAQWQDQSYVGIARNYTPDHLAILPDRKGACSIEKGAGLLRNQEVSHEDLRALLWRELASRLTADRDFFIDSVFDGFFVHWLDGELFKQDFTITDGSVTFVGDPVQVERVTMFRTVETGELVGNQEESSMDKKKFVDGLIANSSWQESDRSFLMSCDEKQLRNMGPTLNEDGTVKEEPGEGEDEAKKQETAPTGNAAPKATPPPQQPAPKKAATLEEFIANAPPELRGPLHMAQRSHAQKKAEVMSRIAANERNSFTPEQLNAMDLHQLEQIAALCGPVSTPSAPAMNYSGLGEVLQFPTANGPKVEPLELPSYEEQSA